jgi:putative glutamine amidotransferase
MMESNAAPLIGMPAQMDPGEDLQYLSRHYADAVVKAGGAPVILPLTGARDPLGRLGRHLDGILLTGSHSDLDPALYGAARSEKCGPTRPERDRMDFLILEKAFQRRIPVLAICFGIQSLNVFCGGTLVQDIPACLGTGVRHGGFGPGQPAMHKIGISSGSVLEQIAGGADVVVNSAHHQAVDRPGKDLEVIARAPDGVVESVVCSSRNHWVLGVQWHPEKNFEQDGFSLKIFESFLAQCRAVRGSNEGTNS